MAHDVYDIIGMDVLWLDELITVATFPEANGSTPVQQHSQQGGGKVATAMAAAGRLGTACKLLAVAGTSARSCFLTEDLERHGVDTSDIRIVPGYHEGFSIVVSDSVSRGRRIFWQDESAQGGLTAEDVERIRPALSQAKYLHLCRLDGVHRLAAEIVRASGGCVSLDADFYSEEIRSALPLVDIFIGSEGFYHSMFTGGEFWENLRHIADQGPSTVIFTFGSQGCRGMVDGAVFSLPAFTNNIHVVDTVGAGDVFHGAYLAALCHGIAGGEEAARFASAVSAVKCNAIGGRAGIPTWEMTQAYLREGTVPWDEIQRRVAFYEGK